MSFLNNMYGKKNQPQSEISDKNPNRVAGGLRGQGADHYTLLGEDGFEKQVPTQKYVQSLEEKIKLLQSGMTVLERKLTRATSTIEQLQAAYRNIRTGT